VREESSKNPVSADLMVVAGGFNQRDGLGECAPLACEDAVNQVLILCGKGIAGRGSGRIHGIVSLACG